MWVLSMIPTQISFKLTITLFIQIKGDKMSYTKSEANAAGQKLKSFISKRFAKICSYRYFHIALFEP